MPAIPLAAQVPEICVSDTPEGIPWKDAVVWTEVLPSGRKFLWIAAEHIESVTWTNGNLSILPRRDTILSDNFQALVVMGGTALVGKNIRAS